MKKLKESKGIKEERLIEIRKKRDSVAEEMLRKYPNLEIAKHNYGIDVISYIPSYHNRIITSRVSRPIYEKPFNIAGYVTSIEAVEAITPVVGRAKKKFKEILDAFLKIQLDTGCTISSWSEECGAKLCVEFKMENFDFFFDIPEC